MTMELENEEGRARESYRRWLLALALGTVVALALHPETGPLMREQIQLPSAPVDRRGPDYQAIAARHPEDYRIQLAAAAEELRLAQEWKEGPLSGPTPFPDRQWPLDRLSTMHDLRARFGGAPPALANLLRLAAITAPRIRRTEYLEGMGPPFGGDLMSSGIGDRLLDIRVTLWKPEERERWTSWDRVAAEGERADPQNAYFPFVRSISLFALERDREALAALRRASCKPNWDEYLEDEPAGRWRVHEIHDGHATAHERTFAWWRLHFGVPVLLHESATTAVELAWEAERAGRLGEGLEIRRSVARCGMKVRVESRTFISSLNGGRMTNACFKRPGGYWAPRRPSTLNSGEEIVAWRRKLYTNYLEKRGYAAEAAWVRADATDQQQLTAIRDRTQNRFADVDLLLHLLKWWWADLIILSNLLWMLSLAAVAALLGRAPWIRHGRPMPENVRAAILAASAGVALGLGFQSLVPSQVLPFLIILPALMLMAIRLHPRYRGRTGGMAWPLAGVVGVAAVVWGAALGQKVWIGQMLSWWTYVNDLVACLCASCNAVPLSRLATLLAAAAPALTVGGLVICSLVLRVPLVVGLTRGLRGAAIPLACLLILAYGGCLSVTARFERQVTAAAYRTLSHEGRRMAREAGLNWPGQRP